MDKTELAMKIYISVLASGQGLGSLSVEERAEAFKEASILCFEAAEQFLIVAKEQTDSFYNI